MRRVHFFLLLVFQIFMKQIFALSTGIVKELLKDVLRIATVLLFGFFCK